MVIMNDLEQLSFTFKLIKYGYFIIRTIKIRVDTVNILKGIIGSPIRIIRKSNVCNDGNWKTATRSNNSQISYLLLLLFFLYLNDLTNYVRDIKVISICLNHPIRHDMRYFSVILHKSSFRLLSLWWISQITFTSIR